jgi:heme exporter protein A
VSAQGLSKRYGRQRALSDVSLRLRSGSVCALLGPNGAGKSTLVGILSTLVKPTAGHVVFEGLAPNGDASAVRAAIGVLSHDSFVYGELDAVENLAFYGQLYEVPDRKRRATELLDAMGLDASARVRPARTYSRGMLQRLALARALLHRPQVLLLDEPFAGLDRKGTRALADALGAAKEESRVILVVTHDLEATDGLCDHVVVLNRGKVALDESRPTTFSHAELSDLYASAAS